MDETDKDNQNIGKNPINYANAFRIGFTENEFNVDFGIKGNDEKITIVSSAAIPVKLMEKLLIGLLISIREYEKKYKTKLLALIDDEDEEME